VSKQFAAYVISAIVLCFASAVAGANDMPRTDGFLFALALVCVVAGGYRVGSR
jgi:hypothetical protein